MPEEKEFKKYNEQLKMLESLEKRETDLLQKMSQADPERDADIRGKWARELVNVVDARTTVRDECTAFLGRLKTEPVPGPAPERPDGPPPHK